MAGIAHFRLRLYETGVISHGCRNLSVRPTPRYAIAGARKFPRYIRDNRCVVPRPRGAVLAIILKGFTMGAARVHDRTCISLRRRLLVTAACSLGLLVQGPPPAAQNTHQT